MSAVEAMAANGRIYFKILIAAVRAKMEYKTSFLFLFFALVIYYAAQIGVVVVVLAKFKNIAGWSLGEMAFLYGIMVFSQGLTTLLFSSLNDFEELMIHGDFDRLLVRPLSPLGQILSSKFEVASIAHFGIGITALWFGSVKAGVDWSVSKALFLPLVILGAVLIQGGIRLAVAAIAFWTVRNRSLVHTVVYSSKEMILYPVSIYRWWMQVFLTIAFPLAFINFYPSYYFLSRDASGLLFHPLIQFLTPAVGVIVFAGAWALWRLGVGKYQSVGN
ncbi:MAG: ABC-2 family transporter protein [Nitrospinae bacterium]|nr:ABC-2 family transporter protein [Nitrospinota bacterium]